MDKRGITLFEITIAVFILGVSLLPILQMTSFSNRSSMSAYFELLGFQLANEPLTIFRAIGYQRLLHYDQSPLEDYPLSEDRIISTIPAKDAILRPTDAGQFSRRIEMNFFDDQGIRGVTVTVTVHPAGQNRLKAWLTKDLIQCSTTIFEQPQ